MVLRTLSRGASAGALATRPAPGEWSATEILGHLRANAAAWGGTIQRMLDEEQPAIRYVSPRALMKKPEYSGRGFDEALALFAAERRELVARLSALTAEGWARTATFTGTTRRQATVLDYAERMATHEAEHLAQFEATLSV
jgi:hypothetical protein